MSEMSAKSWSVGPTPNLLIRYSFRLRSGLNQLRFELLAAHRLADHLLEAVDVALAEQDALEHLELGCGVLALGALHGQGLLYRGLGEPSAVVDARGYIVLSNFRYARRLLPGAEAFTLCGEHLDRCSRVAHNPILAGLLDFG